MVNLPSHPVPPARFRLHLENARGRNSLFHLTPEGRSPSVTRTPKSQRYPYSHSES